MTIEKTLWVSIVGGMFAAICASFREDSFATSLAGFAFLSLVEALFLGLALACLRPLIRRERTSTAAFFVCGTGAACFLDLCAMFLTFDAFCPALRSGDRSPGLLGDPCSGWPVFVDFHYAAWPIYAGLNLALWVVSVFAAIAVWTQFGIRSNRKLSD
jgi:hypothetical protein